MRCIEKCCNDMLELSYFFHTSYSIHNLPFVTRQSARRGQPDSDRRRGQATQSELSRFTPSTVFSCQTCSYPFLYYLMSTDAILRAHSCIFVLSTCSTVDEHCRPTYKASWMPFSKLWEGEKHHTPLHYRFSDIKAWRFCFCGLSPKVWFISLFGIKVVLDDELEIISRRTDKDKISG